MKKRLFEILRFYIGSGIGSLLGYGLYYTLTEFFGVWYIIASISGFILNCIIGFTVKKFWVFKSKDIKIIKKQILIYVIISIVYLAVDTGIVYLFVEYLHVPQKIAPIIPAIFLSFVSYLVNKKVTFAK